MLGSWSRAPARAAPFIDKDLVIVGRRTKRTGKPVLDGRGKARVLTIKPRVKVDHPQPRRRGTVQPPASGWWRYLQQGQADATGRRRARQRGDCRAAASSTPGSCGCWVAASSGATYRTGGAAMSVGGLYNVGRAVLDDSARIRKNNMGTIVVVNEGTLTMKGASDISDNSPFHGPSRHRRQPGTMVMDGTAGISGRAASRTPGTLVMNGASSIHDNTTSGCVATVCGPAGRPGAGVLNTGSLALNDTASIHHNRVAAAQSPGLPRSSWRWGLQRGHRHDDRLQPHPRERSAVRRERRPGSRRRPLQRQRRHARRRQLRPSDRTPTSTATPPTTATSSRRAM